MREASHPLEPTEGSLAPGDRLGRYRVIRPLASGGMAELHLAQQRGAAGFEKVVVLKRVRAHLAGDAEFARLFLNEARLASGLDHSGIAHVLDFGVERGLSFIVMEYVHGPSLLELLKRTAPQRLPVEVALTVVRDVAAALHYAHERAGADGRPLGLVHRDVSPSNILLTYDGEVKLVDFGIAKATALPQATRSTSIKGKLGYMSPEQAKGEALDRRTDVFALGTVAFELCTARRCFVAPGDLALLNKVAAAQYPRPSSIDPEFDDALAALIDRALQVRPEARYPSARAFQEAIEGYASERGLRLSNLAVMDAVVRACGRPAYPVVAASHEPTSATRPEPSRRPIWPVAAGLSLLVGVGVGAWAGGRGVPVSDPTPARGRPAAAAVEPRPRPADAATSPEPEPAAPAVVEPSPSETAQPAAEPSSVSPLRPRKRRRRARPKKKASAVVEPTAKAPAYLPPSRR